MPIVHTDPNQPDHRQHIRVARNDSLRSDRSDKRVSFNKDVGVKHIPRGQKNNTNLSYKNVKDEWSNCEPVHLQKSKLSSHELEQQAEDLVRLLDNVNCVSGSKPVPHPDFSSRSLDKSKNKNKLNNLKLLNNENNQLNNQNRNHISSSQNNISYGNKENVLNKNKHSNNSNGNHIYNSPYKKFGSTYESVPNIPTTIYYNNTKSPPKYLIENNISDSNSFMSVDNLYNTKGNNNFIPRHSRLKNKNHYNSVDNIASVNITDNKILPGYNIYENTKAVNSTPIKSEMPENKEYRPKVGNMIKRFNSDSGEHRVKTHTIHLEDTPQRNYNAPNEYKSRINNIPFSYTSAPLSSLEETRRVSPSRDIPFRKEGKSFTQVNKPERRARSSSRDYDINSRNTDSDYSAKIIITGNNINTRYDDDDHAYETYQVGGDSFSKHARDYGMSADDSFDDYKRLSNPNMNMSSIGVQTDRVPKPPQRSRRNNRLSREIKSDFSDQDYKENLTSASLVRRINHGFGRVDRSPSPQHIKRTTMNRMPRNVVPLLSDTDDSEYDYKRRVDPLAKIRNQVMLRELQEERESQEREEELFNHKNKAMNDFRSSDMQPLTVDEIDALTLEVDKGGRNSLIVSRDNNYHRSTKQENINNNVSTLSHGKKHPENNSKSFRERSKSPGIFSTLERIKNNNFKSSLERNKAKDKKKKKIKIKFFYDPRPQDKPNEDPLERYTEYKGEYSDSQEAQKLKKSYDDVDYYNDKRNVSSAQDYPSLSRETRREKERRYRYDSSESPSRDGSKPNRYINSSRDRSSERIKSPNNYTKRYTQDSSTERVARKDNKSFTNEHNKMNYNRPNYDSSLERRMARDQKNNLHKVEYFESDFQKRNHRNETKNDSRYVSNRSVEQAYEKNSEHNKKKGFVKKIEFSDDTDHHEFSDPGQKTLSEKYRSLTRKDSPPRQKTILRNSEQNNIEESEKKEKIERQRKKFFGVLKGEGKTKYPASSKEESRHHSPSETKHSSTTLPRPMQSQKDTQASSTLHRVSRDQQSTGDISQKSSKDKKSKIKGAPIKPKKSRPWPWSLLRFKGAASQNQKRGKTTKHYPRSSRPPSRASSRASTNPRRPTVRSSKIRKDIGEGRSYISRDREADVREKQHWESATHSRTHSSPRETRRDYTPSRQEKDSKYSRDGKYSADSSPSSHATPTRRLGRTPSFQERYFGESDAEKGRRNISVNSGSGNYQSLPNRRVRTHGSRQNLSSNRNGGIRKPSPGTRGSAGSSLQSSESEADSHGGSHASRASHVSTGSNRSVYLHATAVADIPVRRSSDESPSERGVSRQSRKVARSFSLVSPWKPRHYREKYEVEYDNREVREARENKEGRSKDEKFEKKNALPPRPPRKMIETPSETPKKMGRSQTVYKDSKLAGWLRRKKNKDVKGI